MIEAPEALILSEQLNQTIKGKRISFVSAGYTRINLSGIMETLPVTVKSYSIKLSEKHMLTEGWLKWKSRM